MSEILSLAFLSAVLQITIIDVLLGADNAILIAMACRNLPPHQKKAGVLYGCIAAIALRVILIFFAIYLLHIPFLKLFGGLMLIKIGIDLLRKEDEVHKVDGSSKLWTAVKTIIVADFLMSLDNVIGIASVAENSNTSHSQLLIVLGVLISVPIIMYGSSLVLRMIDRFPIIVYLGAMLLGWIGGELMFTDVQLQPQIHTLVNNLALEWFTYDNFKHLVAATFAAIVLIIALLLNKREKKKAA